MRYLAVILVALAVEGVLWVLWMASGAVVDKCNQGEDLWLCSDTVAQGLVVGLIAVPIVALVAAVVLLAARKTRQQRDSN